VAEVLLFHHAQGRTPGIVSFAAALERAGHTVHVPDLFEGRTFDDLAGGIAYAEQVGFDALIERGRRVAEALPNDLVYAGFSLGVLPAQLLAQTRPGARGALFVDACVAVSEFGTAWPKGVPVEIHAMDADPLFIESGDLEAARALVASVERAELRLYPGDRHLFADSSLSSYDEVNARLLEQRVIAFLASITSMPSGA
jgi:dienelactone hydrolase